MLGKTVLPPGFRFHPTDVELVLYYLKRKVIGKAFRFEAISEVELYKYPPWELPEKSLLHTKDLEWYFFCPRDRKYPNGSRTNRATDSGYWKPTGKARFIIHNSHTVGTAKTLIFHEGKPRKGNRTDWVMHEYRLESKELVDTGYAQDSYVLCKIYKKSGRGPKIGEQHGAPYNEEEWEEDAAAESSLHLPCVPCQSQPSNNEIPSLDLGTAPLIISSVIEVPSDQDLEISLAELVKFPNSSPTTEIENIQMFDSTNHEIYNNEAEFEELFNDLDDIFTEEIFLNINQVPCEIALDSDDFIRLGDFQFLGNSNASEPMVPNDPFSLHTDAQCPNSQNLDYIISPYPDFNALLNSDDVGPDITNALIPQHEVGYFGEDIPCEIAPHRELDSDGFMELGDFHFFGNGDASVPMMPNDLFSLHTDAQCLNSQNLDYILSPNPDFNVLHNSDDVGLDITNAIIPQHEAGNFGEIARPAERSRQCRLYGTG